MHLKQTSIYKRIAAFVAWSLILGAAAPTGWFLAGSKPGEYDCAIDPAAAFNSQPSTFLKSKDGVKPTGFGTLMQDFSATDYMGKRVRLTANVKSEGVEHWAGLWMRVDNRNASDSRKQTLAFDNMQSRPIKNTTGWQSYSVVLDVPAEATGIFLGILLDGSGEVWLNGIKFEVVGSDVPTTGASMPAALASGPTNLGFEKQ